MPDRHPTIWPLQPHTVAKHSIFRRHLQAWFPKLSWNGRLRVIDGFAGPGEYTGGEPGSPIIAIEVAKTHTANLASCQIEYVFIEEDLARYQNLAQKIADLSVPGNIAIEIHNDSFRNVLAAALDDVTRRRSVFPPSFVMIDPFGFEGVPMQLIQRIAAQPRSEVLISFMYDSVTRWLGDPRNAANFDQLFDSHDWHQALNIDESNQRRSFLLDRYIAQLHSHGWRYVRSFEMKDEGNRTEYFLIFGSNHIEGLKVMKEAMWRVDPSGRYVFSDATDPRQLTLFAPTPDFDQLKRLILERFPPPTEVAIEKLEEFVWLDTAFLGTHLRKPILIPNEKGGDLEVLTARKMRFTYPNGTRLRFLR